MRLEFVGMSNQSVCRGTYTPMVFVSTPVATINITVKQHQRTYRFAAKKDLGHYRYLSAESKSVTTSYPEVVSLSKGYLKLLSLEMPSGCCARPTRH